MTTGGNFTVTGTHTYSTAPVLPASTIDAITEIATALKSGADAKLITGTAGTNNYTSKWNSDGDLVDGYEVLDEDNMASDSATKISTQQSIKAYVDTRPTLSNVLCTLAEKKSITNTSNVTIWRSRFKKPIGVNTVTVHYYGDQTAPNHLVLVCTIGTATNSGDVTSATPVADSFDVDISGLVVGTVYEFKFEVSVSSGTGNIYGISCVGS